MTYEEALEFLNAPAYDAIRPGLDTVTELLELLGNPQEDLKYVHIAGTNGKGSTAAFIESILRVAGYKTGLYTSPFIQRFTERIRVNGEEISSHDLARLTEPVQAAVAVMRERGHLAPTAFELVTALGFLYFKEQQCDIVVLETGLGGRLDATNVIACPEVAVITAIALDHMKILGGTLAEIAGEKAGIIKGGFVVTYPQQPEAAQVLQDRCHQQGASLTIAPLEKVERRQATLAGQEFSLPTHENLRIALLGSYQIENAVLAVTAIEALQKKGYDLTEEALYTGLQQARWPGRLEVMGKAPVFLIDGAHNPHGVQALRDSLAELFPQRRFTFITGVLADKNYKAMMQLMMPLARRVLTVTPPSPRALPGRDLAKLLQQGGIEAQSCASITAAVDLCRNTYKNDIICAFGSLYYIGEVRSCLQGDKSSL